MIQNTYAIVAQDASDSSGLAVLETNVILKPTRPHHYEAFDLHRVILVNEKLIMWQHRTSSSFDLIS